MNKGTELKQRHNELYFSHCPYVTWNETNEGETDR